MKELIKIEERFFLNDITYSMLNIISNKILGTIGLDKIKALNILNSLYKTLHRVNEIYYTSSGLALEQLIFHEKFYKRDEKEIKKNLEKDYQNKIINEWSKINQFKNYNFIASEYKIGTGRIDILANCNITNRPIIIELKINKKRPDRQLLCYSTYFKNPILIGISDIKFKNTNNIIYYTYDELNIILL